MAVASHAHMMTAVERCMICRRLLIDALGCRTDASLRHSATAERGRRRTLYDETTVIIVHLLRGPPQSAFPGKATAGAGRNYAMVTSRASTSCTSSSVVPVTLANAAASPVVPSLL